MLTTPPALTVCETIGTSDYEHKKNAQKQLAPQAMKTFK